MPYRRKRFHRRRSSATKNLKFIKNRKGARSQQLQMVSLQRQLTATKNKLRDRAQWSQWELPLEPSTLGNSVDLENGEFYVVGLTRPAAMTGLFQSTTGGGTIPPIPAIAANIAHYKSFDIQMIFSPKNSLTALTPRICRVYVLSLKSETAQDTLANTGGMNTAGLNSSTPGAYTHVTNSDGGLPTLVKFNPAAFKIHAYREFTLANIVQETAQPLEDEDVPITNTRDALKRCRIRLKTNTKIKPPQGTWREMTEPEIMPLDRKYLVVHVGGWAADQDNQVHMDTNIVVNMRETN
jgi:hypothetical protein